MPVISRGLWRTTAQRCQKSASLRNTVQPALVKVSRKVRRAPRASSDQQSPRPSLLFPQRQAHFAGASASAEEGPRRPRLRRSVRVVRHPLGLVALVLDASFFCAGYVMVSSLLTGARSLVAVDPRMFVDGTFNARVVVASALLAGLLLVGVWRIVDHVRRRRRQEQERHLTAVAEGGG